MLNLPETHPTRTQREDFNKPCGDNVWSLPGFVEDNVTMESHHFWVVFEGRLGGYSERWATASRPTATLHVEHGGGIETLRLPAHTARALRDMYLREMHTAAFHLCWGLFDMARGVAANERRETLREVFTAFVMGRLKKRKVPRRAGCQVWIEPKQGRFYGTKHTIAFETEEDKANA